MNPVEVKLRLSSLRDVAWLFSALEARYEHVSEGTLKDEYTERMQRSDDLKAAMAALAEAIKRI